MEVSDKVEREEEYLRELSSRDVAMYKEQKQQHSKAISKAVKCSVSSLLWYEKEMYEGGEVVNITHRGSSSLWLEAPSSVPPPGFMNVYRPMGDLVCLYF